jgi:hypothetical protein
LERCRLMTEEKQAMAKNATTMKERLDTIQESLVATKRDLIPREAAVQNLSKQVRGMEYNESFTTWSSTLRIYPNVVSYSALHTIIYQVQFQHNELLNARDKIKHLESKMAKDAQEREQTLVEAQERVRRRHERFQSEQTALEEAPAPAVPVASSTKNNKLDSTRLELTQELQFDTNTNHDYWWNQMPKLLKGKASLIMRQQVHIKSLENEQMERVLRGYQELLGDPVPDESGDLDVMENAQQQDHKMTTGQKAM